MNWFTWRHAACAAGGLVGFAGNNLALALWPDSGLLFQLGFSGMILFVSLNIFQHLEEWWSKL